MSTRSVARGRQLALAAAVLFELDRVDHYVDARMEFGGDQASAEDSRRLAARQDVARVADLAEVLTAAHQTLLAQDRRPSCQQRDISLTTSR